jgi:hypothetical protein
MRFRRLKLALLFFCVAALAVELAVHNHSLSQGADGSGVASQALCVVCATGVDRVVPEVPVTAAPQVSTWEHAEAPLVSTLAREALSLSSRAPPVVAS